MIVECVLIELCTINERLASILLLDALYVQGSGVLRLPQRLS